MTNNSSLLALSFVAEDKIFLESSTVSCPHRFAGFLVSTPLMMSQVAHYPPISRLNDVWSSFSLLKLDEEKMNCPQYCVVVVLKAIFLLYLYTVR